MYSLSYSMSYKSKIDEWSRSIPLKGIIFLCINLLLFLSNSTKGVPQLRNDSEMFLVMLHINKNPHKNSDRKGHGTIT